MMELFKYLRWVLIWTIFMVGEIASYLFADYTYFIGISVGIINTILVVMPKLIEREW